MNCYTIFKRTATHADALAAIGAADLLRHLAPRIAEHDDRFEIQLKRSLHPSDLDMSEPGFSYLERRGKKTPNLPPERIVSLGSGSTASETRMYSILGRMKAYGGPNQVVSRYARMDREEWTKKVWDCLHGRADFVFRAPLVQLFNPQSAKGFALLKPRGTDRNDKTKDRWAEPFLEWLRFRGYFESAAAWFTSGDLRVFCPVPAGISYDHFAVAASAFRDLRLGGTAVKIDCRAILGLTRLLIESGGICRRPRELVSTVWVTHYKDMGQAHTVFSTEQLAIPDWLELETRQQKLQWLAALEEHETVLRRLTDSHSDELALLRQYRRTFQSQPRESLSEFVGFLAEYGVVLFQRRAQGHWLLPQFSVASVAPILRRDPDLRKILRNPGFLAIASAIRASTVGAQGARHLGRTDHRQIRYGLLSDLRHASFSGRHELLDAVFTANLGIQRGRRAAPQIGSPSRADPQP